MNMYFIAIVLPEELNKEITQYKTLMLERWGCQVGLKSPAHITLVPPFWMPGEMEETLLQDVDSLSKQLHSFTITTNNFSCFKPRTIFVAVAQNEALNEVKKATDAFFKNNDAYKVKRDNRPFHPHITIATRDLHKKAFSEAWPLFEQKTFSAEFKAEGLATLRHNKKTWDVIQTSGFLAGL